MRGAFEAHLTVDTDRADFAALCRELGVDHVGIELAEGVHRAQPMTASHHRGELADVMVEVEALRAKLVAAGFTVVRTKLEAAVDNEGIPTAGGYYDHIEPPKPLDLGIDGSSSINAQSRTVYYGPRVPLLALGPFARHGTVAHTYLEMSSIGAFLEWNWLHGRLLKGVSETTDQRAYRDTVVNNIGSLIDPGAAGIEVPDGPL